MAQGDETNEVTQPSNQQTPGGSQPPEPQDPADGGTPPQPDRPIMDVYASRAQIIALAAYLIVLTVGLLAGIVTSWPSCETETGQRLSANENRNANGNGNANGNANRNANGNGNANGGGNTNAADNTNNTNAGGNTNGVAPNINSATPQNSNRATPTGAPDIDSVTPDSGPTTGGNSVTVKGKNLDGVAVSFGGAPATESTGGGTSLSVKTPPHVAGKVEVKVERGDVSDSLPDGFTYSAPAACGNLFLLVIFAGALGGTAHAIRSLFWYVGNKDLKESWLLMYVLLPFSGSTIAMIFYLIILGGLRIGDIQGGTSAFSAVAIAAIVGLFSQQAALKLRDIANAILTKPGEGNDSVPQKSKSVNDPNTGSGGAGGVSPKITPPSGTAGQKVSITGTSLTDVGSVTFGTVTASGFTFDAATGSINGVAPQQSPGFKGVVDVIVKNTAGKSEKVQYKYT